MYEHLIRYKNFFCDLFRLIPSPPSQKGRSLQLKHKADSVGADRGYSDHYRFGIFSNENGGSTLIVPDSFLQLQAVNNVLRITVIIFPTCILIIFALLLVLSKRAVRPFADDLERQLVADASHELKTPLAILSADMGLLEDTYGAGKWLEGADGICLKGVPFQCRKSHV